MPVLNLNTAGKRKRVSKPDREATAHKKQKDRSKKRRYDTDYSSSSEMNPTLFLYIQETLTKKGL
jgi:hypothetical protein